MKQWSALLLLSVAGCLSLSFQRINLNEPVRPEQCAELRPGEDGLDECLAKLGAPLRVFEYHVGPDRRSGVALLWYWYEASGFGIDASAAYKEASGSFEYNQLAAELPGCMLWFDDALRLERWRFGTIGDLLPGRARPAPATENE